MSDTRLRMLERRWRETGSQEDHLAFLRERIRSAIAAKPRRGPPSIVEGDDWTTEGAKVLAPDFLAPLLQETCKHGGGLVVEHRHYRGGSAPSMCVLDSLDALVEYVITTAKPGDAIWTWSYSELCRRESALSHDIAEEPDEEGRTTLTAGSSTTLDEEEQHGRGERIVEHLQRESGSVTRFVVNEVYALLEFVRDRAKPGDELRSWHYWALCRDDNSLAHGKLEDDRGRVPRGGAY